MVRENPLLNRWAAETNQETCPAMAVKVRVMGLALLAVVASSTTRLGGAGMSIGVELLVGSGPSTTV